MEIPTSGLITRHDREMQRLDNEYKEMFPDIMGVRHFAMCEDCRKKFVKFIENKR